MKKIFSLLVLLCVSVFAFAEATENGKLPSEERHEVAKKLHGLIKVVKNPWEADFRVCIVKPWEADLRAFVYEDSASYTPGVGRWYYVKPSDGPRWDFSICFVNNMSEADVYVHFVKYVSEVEVPHFSAPPLDFSSPL